MRDLAKPIEGLEAGKDFEGHIKGKCRGHEVRGGEKGKATHHYDLDVHDFEHKGSNGAPKKKDDGLHEAFEKHLPKERAKTPGPKMASEEK